MKVYIINGSGGVGKDTFCETVYKLLSTDGSEGSVANISSIDYVKLIAKKCGWDGDKNEKGRKLLSDLKKVLTEYNDSPFDSITREVDYYKSLTDTKAVFIHIREPEEIERAVKEFNAKTILITNDRVKTITSNSSDSSVYDYQYDYMLSNDGTFEQLTETAMLFALEEGLFVE